MRANNFGNLLRLLGIMPVRRRWQFVGVLVLTLVGAVAELISIGAVVPFLQLIAAPKTLARLPILGTFLQGYLGNPGDLLVPAAIVLATTAIVSALIRMLLVFVTNRYVSGLTHDLSMIVFGRVIRQPYSLFIQRNSAEVLSGLDKVGVVGAYLIAPLLTALSSLVIAIGIIGLLFSVNSTVALISGSAIIFLYLMVGVVTKPRLLRGGRRLAATSTARVKLTQESLGGIRDIILDHSHGMFERQFKVVDAEARRATAQQNTISQVPRYLVEGVGIVLIAVFAIFYAHQPGGVVQAIPLLGVLALSAQRLLPLVQNVNYAWVQYAATVGFIADIFNLIDAPVLVTSRNERVVPFRDTLELKDVSFQYTPDISALKSIDLRIERGQRIGFMGTSGSGKSTLIDIIMGLISPSDGEILVDGETVDVSNIGAWQAQISHVPQTIFLADTSIAANIAFGVSAEAIDLERVRHSADQAGVDQFIRSLANGYDTLVGERGVQLSGGQRQRIGIARALYKRANILILDEATSALDIPTEVAVMEAVRKLDSNLTVLIVAHRLSTLKNCDFVYRLEAGAITDRGRYEDVVQRAAG